MSKTKKVASVAFAGAAAVAATGAAAGPAFAAPGDWTVMPAGQFTAFNNTSLIFSANGLLLACPSVNPVPASLVGTAAGTPAQLGTIGSVQFGTSNSPCQMFFSAVLHLKKAAQLSASSYTDPITRGRIGNGSTSAISASINGVNGWTCHMEIRGTSLPWSYNNDTGFLNVNPGRVETLTITSIPDPSTSCVGLFRVGMPAWFANQFSVSPKQTITHDES
jgi:hypothetical protein